MLEEQEIFEKLDLQLQESKDKKVYFWGASNFLKKYLNNTNHNYTNIQGIIDSNPSKSGKTFCGHLVFTPDEINITDDVIFIFTIYNNHYQTYNEIKSQYGNKLLTNIFLAYEYSSIDKKIPLGFEQVSFIDEDINAIKSLGPEFEKYSEMSNQDKIFLNALIRKKQPTKILELGVSKGGSSIIILNAIKNRKNAELFSLDYCTMHYKIKDKKTGFYVDNYPELKSKWNLHTGGLALNFLDKISSSTKENEKFDFCFIDTAHCLPGEILDVLQILPYLKQNATLVLHDTNLQLNKSCNVNRKMYFVNNILLSALQGKKLIPSPLPYESNFGYFFNNIAAIELNIEKQLNCIYDIFNLLTLRWQYLPSTSDIKQLMNHLNRFYNNYYSEYFKHVVKMQMEMYQF